MGPAPMTTSDPGSSVTRVTSRLVQYGVSASPSTGGTPGSVPVATTTARDARNRRPSTSTSRSPTSRPWPRTTVAPDSSSRSTDSLSSQWWVCSATRAAAGAHDGSTVARPASVADAAAPRRGRRRERIITLLGMQP